jgi:hypothetical protein
VGRRRRRMRRRRRKVEEKEEDATFRAKFEADVLGNQAESGAGTSGKLFAAVGWCLESGREANEMTCV